jgi:hypothetical protein
MTDPAQGGAPESQDRRWTPPDLFEARIKGTPESFAELLKRFDLDVGCRPHVHPNDDGTGTLTAFATQERIGEIQAAGYVWKLERTSQSSDAGDKSPRLARAIASKAAG